MKKVFQIIGLLLFSHVILAQNNLQKVVNKNIKTGKKEIYYIDKSNGNKQGSYILKVNGVLRIEGEYKDNKRDGDWKFYHGLLKIEGSYENDLKEGTWFYTKNQDTLSVLSFLLGKHNGEQKGYYKGGELASRLNYFAGTRNGKSEYYYSNGKLSEDCEYLLGERHGDDLIYDEDGNLIYKFIFAHEIPVQFAKFRENTSGYYYLGNIKDGSGYLETYTNDKDGNRHLITLRNFKDSLYDGIIAGYDTQDKPSFKGQYKEGFMIGEWNFYTYLGELKTTKNYQVSDSLTHDPEELSTKNYNERFFIIQDMPEYPGGDMNLRRIIAQNITYPEICKENGYQGRVFVQFVVNCTGELEQAKVVRSVHPLLDNEAIRVIKELPPWTPGFQHGIPVKVSFTVPISFSLN